jgi:2-oxoglutarate ferredoxin oxidoreductase subunit beta
MNKIIEALNRGIENSRVKREKVCIVTDIPYNPGVVSDLGTDLFHTSRGRAIPFATGMKLANPKLKPVVLIGDMATLGGNHFVHACRRNMDIMVICVNDFIHQEIGGETAPGNFDKVTFAPYVLFEDPLNIPHLARSCGSVYVARWTMLHTNELVNSISEALSRTGLSVIDVISPPSGLLEFYYNNSEIMNDEDTANVAITKDKKIVVGKFFEGERPTFIDAYNQQLSDVLGNKFVKIEV